MIRIFERQKVGHKTLKTHDLLHGDRRQLVPAYESWEHLAARVDKWEHDEGINVSTYKIHWKKGLIVVKYQDDEQLKKLLHVLINEMASDPTEDMDPDLAGVLRKLNSNVPDYSKMLKGLDDND